MSESESTLDPDKILLFPMELMLNRLNIGTKCLGMVFILKSQPKLHHLSVLFQERSRRSDVVSQLLLISPRSRFGMIPFSVLAVLSMVTSRNKMVIWLNYFLE